jgi:aspartyl/asparaginyl beta-hydroxylase (cupin superfamily)
MAPNTHIAPHAGPTNLRLRVHLGIDVPSGCGLTVGRISGGWTPGRCIVFDDSFPHEAWNDGDRDRVVLIVDVWHPDLSDDEVALLEGLQRHVTGAAENVRSYWERNDAARAAAPQ